MKIVQINTFSNKSTGSIMMNLHRELILNGHDSYVVWARGRKSKDSNEIFLKSKLSVFIHGLYTRFTDKTGFASKRETIRLIKKLEKIQPDIIHLHNLHGYYINIELLFGYIKKNNIKVVWTLHDCWAFTGHCFDPECINCEKWKSCCSKCPQINEYPKSFTDNSKFNFVTKKKIFTGVNNITVVTPSKWLSTLVSQSFLNYSKLEVINNGIDKEKFYACSDYSELYVKYNIPKDRKIILGVASTWTKLKGLDDFIELSKIINDEYVIVLVGLSKKQLKSLPDKIVAIKRTENTNELTKLYNMATVFFNPTYADNFPTTIMESLACGTPVCTYDTGGCSETLTCNNGLLLKKGDYLGFYSKIEEIVSMKRKYSILNEKFYIDSMIKNYFDLYQKIFEEER